MYNIPNEGWKKNGTESVRDEAIWLCERHLAVSTSGSEVNLLCGDTWIQSVKTMYPVSITTFSGVVCPLWFAVLFLVLSVHSGLLSKQQTEA